jgi:hypothetical protein
VNIRAQICTLSNFGNTTFYSNICKVTSFTMISLNFKKIKLCNSILSLQFSTFLFFSTFSLLTICLMIFQGCHSMEVNMLIHFHSNLHLNLCWNHFYGIAYTNHLLEIKGPKDVHPWGVQMVISRPKTMDLSI